MPNNDMREHLERWEKVYNTRKWGQYPPEELVRFIARTFKDTEARSTKKILEVGCGPGTNIWLLAREGFLTAGIDGSPTAIEIAKKRLAEDDLPHALPEADLHSGNFTSLPWGNDEFDAVVDIEAIYANPMDAIRLTIAEVHRVLRPGGVFFGKMFGTKTSGYNTGHILEDGTSADPTFGPCCNFGFTHFFKENELHDLFTEFSSLDIDWVHRTDNRQKVDIFEWLVTAKK